MKEPRDQEPCPRTGVRAFRSAVSKGEAASLDIARRGVLMKISDFLSPADVTADFHASNKVRLLRDLAAKAALALNASRPA